MKKIAEIPFSKWTLFILELVCLVSRSESTAKNVCRTMDDYRILRKNNSSKCWYDPDVGATPERIARNHGYSFETHRVVTEDGFFLTVFRISRSGYEKKYGPPILLHHGMTVDGASWIMNGKQSAGFVFSDNGFDVWIMNVRGTLQSSKHMRYNPYEEEYWNFSFHEMGYYDLPAVLDYITMTTGRKGQITLIGVSMGTTSSFIYASLRSKHAQENLKGIIALAPVAFLDNARTALKFAARYTNEIKQALLQMEISGLGANMSVIINAIRGVCSTYPFLVFCGIIANIFTGPSTVNPENLPTIFSQIPSGVSVKTLEHYAQIVIAKERFQMFDYGAIDNERIYNSTEPPLYELSKIKVPTTLYYGGNDFMSEEKDVFNLYSKLTSKKRMVKMAFEDGQSYSHIDFVIGKEIDRLFNLVSKHIKGDVRTL